MDFSKIPCELRLSDTLFDKNREIVPRPPFTYQLNCSFKPINDACVSYESFFEWYMIPNKPCVFPQSYTEEWRSRKEWVDEYGKPAFQFLKNTFGGVTVPVADCGKEQYSSHPKQDIKFEDYILYWEDYITSGYNDSKDCLYLKDWHFTREFPDYVAYTTPKYFLSDWLNEFWDTRTGDHDDYRFVYMGPKGSWTPFHADVFRSYSWSANICGKKKWILFPPGEEECLKDKYGNLVYDVTSDDMNNADLYPKYNQLQHKVEIIQEAGEIIFVPSGWHHQVFNLEDTISINHNWQNGCNVDICWSYIKQCLHEVQCEISDCIDMEGWHQQCQLILKASSGINFTEFFEFMKAIAQKRLDVLKRCKNTGTNKCTQNDLFDHMTEQVGELSALENLVISENVTDIGQICPITDSVKDTGDLPNDGCLRDAKDLSDGSFNEKCEASVTDLICDRDVSINSTAEPTNGNIAVKNKKDNGLESDWIEYLNHLKFDLNRVEFIIEDMLKTPEFSVIDSLKSDAINLLSLIKEI